MFRLLPRSVALVASKGRNLSTSLVRRGDAYMEARSYRTTLIKPIAYEKFMFWYWRCWITYFCWFWYHGGMQDFLSHHRGYQLPQHIGQGFCENFWEFGFGVCLENTCAKFPNQSQNSPFHDQRPLRSPIPRRISGISR